MWWSNTYNCSLPFCWHGNVVVGCIYAVEELLYIFALYSVTSILFHTVAFPRNQLDSIYNTRSLSGGLAKYWIITVAIHNKNSANYTQCCVTCVQPLFVVHGPNNGLTQHMISWRITAHCHLTWMYIIRMNQAFTCNISQLSRLRTIPMYEYVWRNKSHIWLCMYCMLWKISAVGLGYMH